MSRGQFNCDPLSTSLLHPPPRDVFRRETSPPISYFYFLYSMRMDTRWLGKPTGLEFSPAINMPIIMCAVLRFSDRQTTN